MANRKIVLIVLLFLTAVVLFTFCSGIYINTTNSVPVGLWIKENGRLVKGKYIVVCPEDNGAFRQAKRNGYVGTGNCKGDYEPLIKPVMALPGDKVSVSKKGIAVNGILIKNSQIAEKDKAGRPLPSLDYSDYTVADGQVWVISSYNNASFDSRYFGALPIKNIRTIVKPLIVR